MKFKAILLLLGGVIMSANQNLNGQVTIGSAFPPNKGCLLELKEYEPDVNNATTTKGMLLPRVQLNIASDLYPILTDATETEKREHTGLAVFHMGSTNLCKGAYSWNSRKWDELTNLCKIAVNCESVNLNGTFSVGTALDPLNNNITLTINATKAAIGGTYNIYTNIQNGISFSHTGTITNETQTITLEGSGIPLSGGKEMIFTIEAEFSNSLSSNTSCQLTIPGNAIPIGRASMLCFGIGSSDYGYYLQSSASRAMFTSSNNFGTNANSTVNSSGFDLNYLAVDGLTVSNFLGSNAWKSNPDIIVNGYYSQTNSSVVIDSLVAYLNRGGVLIMMDEYSANATNISVLLCKKLFPVQAANISFEKTGAGGDAYLIPTTAPEDDITNGPFGDMRGRMWGEDTSNTNSIKGLPSDSIITYTTGTIVGGATKTSVTMFRHKRLNLFYVGDGGFVSNYKTNIGPTYLTYYAYCPFAIDVNYRPIARTSWGAANGKTVYNSQIFANVMYWAVKNAPSNNRKN